jgi:NADPH-dependent 2,4-dienoyl-CoA reductase/sulfur reductase-like enzyme
MAKGKIQSDLLVVGGGTSGVCAAIQAARDGLQVALIEETPWLGGMLTAAGVSAIDGNHRLPSGLWGEFRQKLYEHYGGPGGVKTGWVTHTAFEPRVANQIFHEMVAGEKGINLYKGYWIEEVTKKNQQVIGATFSNAAADRLTIEASLTIDCTEYGM